MLSINKTHLNAEQCYKYNYREDNIFWKFLKEKRKERAFLPTLKHGVSSPKILMNHARLLTDQAIALLENAVIHVLANARESGHAYISGADIGRAMGTYRRQGSPGRIHRIILDKLEDEHRVESLRSESGTVRKGWRLTDAEWNRLTLPE